MIYSKCYTNTISFGTEIVRNISVMKLFVSQLDIHCKSQYLNITEYLHFYIQVYKLQYKLLLNITIIYEPHTAD